MPDLYSNDAIRERAEQLVRTEVIYCCSFLISSLADGGEAAQAAFGLGDDDLMSILVRDDWESPAVAWIESADMGDLIDACLSLEEIDADDIVSPLLRAAIYAHVGSTNDTQIQALIDASCATDDALGASAWERFNTWVRTETDAGALLDACEACEADTSAALSAARLAVREDIERCAGEDRRLCESSSVRVNPEQHEAYEHWIVSRWLADLLVGKGEMIGRDIAGFDAIWGRCATGQGIAMDHVILEIAKDLLDEHAALVAEHESRRPVAPAPEPAPAPEDLAHVIAQRDEMLGALRRLVHPAADDDDIEFAQRIIAEASAG